MSHFVWLFMVILPTILACNMNMGAYKLHNGQGEMSYMDREKSALYSEQGVWVSWKVPVPRHWDPHTGRLRNESPGKSVSGNWSHWNQLADENPPMRKPSTKEIEAANFRINAPDPYREYLRSRQNATYSPPRDAIYFLSAGISPERGTSVEAGVIKGRPRIPPIYLGAMRRPSFSFQPENEGVELVKPNLRPTMPLPIEPMTTPVITASSGVSNESVPEAMVATTGESTISKSGKVVSMD